MPIHYCQCCKINHEQGRRHIFSRQHVKKLQEWSERQQKRVNDCLLLAKNGYANPTITNHSFWCAFCAAEILDEAPMFLHNCLNHLCSQSHIDKVYAFFRENGTNNKLIDQKWFFVGEPFRDEYVENCKSFIHHNKINPSAYSTPAAEYGPLLPSAQVLENDENLPMAVKKNKNKLVSKLEEYPYESLISGPLQFHSGGKEFVTLQSSNGILQNPSGYTETGRRVWGGGIVKLSKKEWQAWPIDLIFMHVRQREEELLKAEEEAARAVLQAKQEDEERIATVRAVANGLTCISLKPSTAGNIHSNALPPWLSSLEENSKALRQWRKQQEYEQRFNKRLRAFDVGVIRGKKAGEAWLPNFGGVWNSGPRHQTREAFREETGLGRKGLSESENGMTSLHRLVQSKGEGMTEEEKKKVIEESKQQVFEKIQMRMHQQKL